ncbi:MAG TPA: protein-glutamine glutaminase family protein, partial [Chitinophagaceae bacterium]|nr:protein-glutamine glutaminase family protein [Chitinophagaceae bacterium]
YFATNPLFRWKDANNDCEDRANAISILLDNWNIPNFKGWVFSGFYLRKGTGSLINLWNYHVAALLAVRDGAEKSFYIIDPATSANLLKLEEWANAVTDQPFSYYFIKASEYYIFPSGKIDRDNWHKRDRRNYKWTIQGLSGINGVSKTGKAQLCFNKKRIKRTEQRFKELMVNKPPLVPL